ncbi:MAG: hypothetical protein KA354_24350 [Phycisphaerae bacterium]|nr:hypothetical protein [Phycisphaerae bacterium]
MDKGKTLSRKKAAELVKITEKLESGTVPLIQNTGRTATNLRKTYSVVAGSVLKVVLIGLSYLDALDMVAEVADAGQIPIGNLDGDGDGIPNKYDPDGRGYDPVAAAGDDGGDGIKNYADPIYGPNPSPRPHVP